MAALPHGERPYTVDDLDLLPDDGQRYEIIDGTLLVTPAPNTRHQRVSMRLGSLLDAACGPGRETFAAPFDFVISAATVVEPDVVVVDAEHLSERRIEGTALLVVEVLSPSTKRTDRTLKRATYAEAGVPWYWIVDPEEPSLTVCRLVGGSYVDDATVRGDDAYVAEAPLAVTVVPSALVAPR